MHKGQWQRSWRITVFGTALCLLAAAFALEAKLGWYSPNGLVRVHFSSTKFQADIPRHSAEALIVPTPSAQLPEMLPHLLAFPAGTGAEVRYPHMDTALKPAQFPLSAPHFIKPPPKA